VDSSSKIRHQAKRSPIRPSKIATSSPAKFSDRREKIHFKKVGHFATFWDIVSAELNFQRTLLAKWPKLALHSAM